MNPGTLPQACGEWGAVGAKYLPRLGEGGVRYLELLRSHRLCKIGHSRPSYRSDTDYSRSRIATRDRPRRLR